MSKREATIAEIKELDQDELYDFMDLTQEEYNQILEILYEKYGERAQLFESMSIEDGANDALLTTIIKLEFWRFGIEGLGPDYNQMN